MIDFIVEFKTNCGYYWGKVYQNKLPILYQFILPLTALPNPAVAGEKRHSLGADQG
jgi:hypothetical protein